MSRNLHLLGQSLLVLHHALHHLVTQIQLGIHLLLIPINRPNLDEQKINALHDVLPLFVLALLCRSHHLQEELRVHRRLGRSRDEPPQIDPRGYELQEPISTTKCCRSEIPQPNLFAVSRSMEYLAHPEKRKANQKSKARKNPQKSLDREFR